MALLRRQSNGLERVLPTGAQIGRAEDCVLCIREQYVSSRHAEVRWTGQVWELRDLGSRNGTCCAGRQLEPREVIVLEAGMVLTFGNELEAWHVLSIAPPDALAIAIPDGERVSAQDGMIVLHGADDATACLCASGDGGWVLEQSWGTRPLAHCETFFAVGRAWKFFAPSVESATLAAGPRAAMLGEVTLEFRVSRDEEQTELTVVHNGSRVSLGERACFYLALTLARRLEQAVRSGDANEAWMSVDEALSAFPQYRTSEHLSVDIYRLRTALARAEIVDAARIIERGRRRIRLAEVTFRILPLPG